MNKRVFVLLLAALLLPWNVTSGLASTEYLNITELKETVPDRWTQTYETKWRTIDIDVQPTIPDVQNIPLLQVAIDFWEPDTTQLGDGAIAYVAENDGRFQVNMNEIRDAINAISDSEDYSAPFDMHNVYGKNSSLTLGDLMDILQSVWSKLGQEADGLHYEKPVQFSGNTCYDKKTGEYLFSDVFIINVKQKLVGITLLGHVSMGIHKFQAYNDFGGTYGDFNFVVSSEEIFYLVGQKMKTIESVAEDVPLCDFDEVQHTLEQEINNGHIRKIFDVDLGYALYNTPGMTNKAGFQKGAVFYAVPVWQVKCLYVENGKTDLRDYSNLAVDEQNTQESKTLLVKAQTGELISPSNAKKGCVDYQDFISWEDVGGKK